MGINRTYFYVCQELNFRQQLYHQEQNVCNKTSFSIIHNVCTNSFNYRYLKSVKHHIYFSTLIRRILINWLIVYCFMSHSRIFHSYGDVIIAGEGLKKFRPMLGAQGLWAGRDLYRATPAVTRDPDFPISYDLFLYFFLSFFVMLNNFSVTWWFSYMMAVSFLLAEERTPLHYTMYWEETIDLPQVNWQTSSYSHIGPNRIRTDAGWRWEVLWYETDVLTTRPRRPPGLIRRTASFSRVLRHIRGYGRSNLTRILPG
jgi:hypothetical protein